MSDGSGELGDLIARARGDGAGPDRLAAVRARLEAQIGPLDVPPSPAAMAVSTKVALGVTALVLAIGIAAWLAARSEAPLTDDSAGASTESVEEPGPGPGPGPGRGRGPGRGPGLGPGPGPGPGPGSEPSVAATAPIDVGGGTASPRPTADRAASAGRAQVAGQPRVAPVVTAPPEAPADPSSSLREEIALLDRAIRARDAGDVARAVATLETHRTRFPSGVLRPERDRMLAELASSAPAALPSP